MSDDNKIVSFDSVKKLKEIKVQRQDFDEEPSKEEVIERGSEIFLETLKEADGFIGLSFSEDGPPQVVYVGEMDLIKTLGLLEYVKNEILHESVAISPEDILGFIDENE